MTAQTHTPDNVSAFLAGMKAASLILERDQHLANFRFDKARKCDGQIRHAFLDGGAPLGLIEEVLGKEAA